MPIFKLKSYMKYLPQLQGKSAGKMQAQNNLNPRVFSFFDMESEKALGMR